MVRKAPEGTTTHVIPTEADQESTTIQEVYDRCLAGTFYDDYDWAAGPALHVLKEAAEKESKGNNTYDIVDAAMCL